MGKRKNKQTRKVGCYVSNPFDSLESDVVHSPKRKSSLSMREPQESTPPKSHEIEESKAPFMKIESDDHEEQKFEASSPCSAGSVQSFEAAVAKQELETVKRENSLLKEYTKNLEQLLQEKQGQLSDLAAKFKAERVEMRQQINDQKSKSEVENQKYIQYINKLQRQKEELDKEILLLKQEYETLEKEKEFTISCQSESHKLIQTVLQTKLQEVNRQRIEIEQLYQAEKQKNLQQISNQHKEQEKVNKTRDRAVKALKDVYETEVKDLKLEKAQLQSKLDKELDRRNTLQHLFDADK